MLIEKFSLVFVKVWDRQWTELVQTLTFNQLVFAQPGRSTKYSCWGIELHPRRVVTVFVGKCEVLHIPRCRGKEHQYISCAINGCLHIGLRTVAICSREVAQKGQKGSLTKKKAWHLPRLWHTKRRAWKLHTGGKLCVTQRRPRAALRTACKDAKCRIWQWVSVVATALASTQFHQLEDTNAQINSRSCT